MRVALCQMNIKYEDKKANLEAALSYIKQAVEGKADVILFPEMSMTGFSMRTEITSESKTRKFTLKQFRKWAAEYHINIGIGWVAGQMEDNIVSILEQTFSKEGVTADRDGKVLPSVDLKLAENHYTMISSKGDILGDYIKIHPFSFASENEYFTRGDAVVHYEIAGIPCSHFICYDLRFPEIFQAVSDKAHVIFVPANWPKARIWQWKMLLAARAIEDQCYVIGVNCVGDQDGVEYVGESCVVDPYGKIIHDMGQKPSMFIMDIQDDVLEIRSKFSVRQDRRPELYAKLLKESRFNDITQD